MLSQRSVEYGTGDASYRAAGEYAGIRQLVDLFYDQMEILPEAKKVLEMHPKDLEESREKLADFLSGWLGGPRVFQEKRSEIRIPMAHIHLKIGEAERDAWLLCMENALAQMDYPQDLRAYLLKQLAIPAERVRFVSENTRSKQGNKAD